jgi:hypothetical protein
VRKTRSRAGTPHTATIKDEYHGLVVQGYVPGNSVHLEVDGVARQTLESPDGHLLLYSQGPENRFADRVITLRLL